MPKKRISPRWRNRLEGRDDLTGARSGGKAAIAAVRGDVIVQLEEVDAVELQTLEACLQ
jgi:hypothetical protein